MDENHLIPHVFTRHKLNLHALRFNRFKPEKNEPHALAWGSINIRHSVEDAQPDSGLSDLEAKLQHLLDCEAG
jgi:hypothetical protein